MEAPTPTRCVALLTSDGTSVRCPLDVFETGFKDVAKSLKDCSEDGELDLSSPITLAKIEREEELLHCIRFIQTLMNRKVDFEMKRLGTTEDYYFPRERLAEQMWFYDEIRAIDDDRWKNASPKPPQPFELLHRILLAFHFIDSSGLCYRVGTHYFANKLITPIAKQPDGPQRLREAFCLPNDLPKDMETEE